MNKEKISVFWFRRDLRLEDNVGLYHALQSEHPVVPIFIFDTNILNDLENNKDRRVDYIHQGLSKIHTELQTHDSGLQTFHATPLDAFKSLSEFFDIHEVSCNRDYEPYAIQRDKEIHDYLKASNISFKAYKDQVIFEQDDILKKDGTPYIVYTPYAKQWCAKLQAKDYTSVIPNFKNLFPQKVKKIHSLKSIGYEKTDMKLEIPELNASVIDFYDKNRDFPAKSGTTQLGIAFRFGTISIRKAVAFALQHNDTWLSELIWREFFMQILYHFPKVVRQSFREKYDHIKWRNNEKEFALWCKGKTGYPIVDAGMRELNETGYMHNRVRMIVASFLRKHLLIDWRWGEAYFAEKLNDYDLSANNGNWQWAAGSGCDAAPYFRVFNPYLQTKKFDKNMEYVRKWVPELDTPTYPEPIVEHKFARERALQVYREGVKRE